MSEEMKKVEVMETENEEIILDDEVEEAEPKKGFFAKFGEGAKKHAKTAAKVAAVVGVGLIAYALGKKSGAGDDEDPIDVNFTEVETETNTEDITTE